MFRVFWKRKPPPEPALAALREPPATATALCTWLGIPPRALVEIFTMPQPIPGVRIVSGTLARGSHHEGYPLRDTFDHVTVILEAPAAGFEAALAAQHGRASAVTRPPRRLVTSEIPAQAYRRYGAWLVADTEIAWHAHLPEWATAPVDEAARQGVLARWIAAARAARSLDELAALASPCAGLAWNMANAGSVHVLLMPALPIGDLLRVIGATADGLVWRGVGVHLAGWRFVQPVGAFELEVWVADPPNRHDGGEWVAPVDPRDRVQRLALYARPR